MNSETFKAAGYEQHTTGGNCMAWQRLTADEAVQVLITNSDGTHLDLVYEGDFFIVGAYSMLTGDSVMDDSVEDAVDADEAVEKAAAIAAQFGGF